MNAGGHGSDIAACLLDVDVVRPGAAEPAPVTMAAGDARPALPGLRPDRRPRRRSPPGCAVRRGDRDAAEATIAEIVRWRREHQPGGQNCGSVFVNPVPGEVSAGSLVDGLGLRGFRIGTAWVSEKHANFVQASEGGSAADVRARDRGRAGAGGRGDRLPAAQRGAPRRVRRGERRDAAPTDPASAAAARRRRAVGGGARRAAAGVLRRRHRPAAARAASTSPAPRSTSCSRRPRRARRPRGRTESPQPSAPRLEPQRRGRDRGRVEAEPRRCEATLTA